MKRIKSMLILIYLTFLSLGFSKSQTEEYVLMEKSHDVKAWQVQGWEKLKKLQNFTDLRFSYIKNIKTGVPRVVDMPW